LFYIIGLPNVHIVQGKGANISLSDFGIGLLVYGAFKFFEFRNGFLPLFRNSQGSGDRFCTYIFLRYRQFGKLDMS